MWTYIIIGSICLLGAGIIALKVYWRIKEVKRNIQPLEDEHDIP